VLVVLALIWYFGFANNNNAGDTNINVNPPEPPAITTAP
jgi:hypothetical protein